MVENIQVLKMHIEILKRTYGSSIHPCVWEISSVIYEGKYAYIPDLLMKCTRNDRYEIQKMHIQLNDMLNKYHHMEQEDLVRWKILYYLSEWLELHMKDPYVEEVKETAVNILSKHGEKI